MDAFVVAFAVVFVAELGDRTQVLVVTRAPGVRVVPALAGLAVVIAVLQAIAVVAGGAIGRALPERAALVLTGVLFCAFALWAWRERPAAPVAGGAAGGDDDADATSSQHARGLRALLGAYFVAELGDKSMLATAALAASNGIVGTWAGASAGLLAATALGLGAGRALARVLPPRVLHLVGVAALLAVGVGALVLAAVQ